MRINFEWMDLRAFLAVVELGSFSKAAVELNLSQPALSRRIKQLEERLGTPLIERTTRSLALTRAGRDLQPAIQRLVNDFEEIMLSTGPTGSRLPGQISIACIPTATIHFLPRAIARFNAQYPLIRFRILDLSAADAFDSVALGHSDFGINVRGNIDPQLRFTHLLDDPYVLACRWDHELASRDSVSWNELKHFKMIGVSRNTISRYLLDDTLAAADIQLESFYEVNRLATSMVLVEAGLAISVVPRLAMAQDSSRPITARPITDPVVSRSVGLIERKAGRLSPAAMRFREMLLSNWSESAQPL